MFACHFELRNTVKLQILYINGGAIVLKLQHTIRKPWQRCCVRQQSGVCCGLRINKNHQL